jgi:hypothetical protein
MGISEIGHVQGKMLQPRLIPTVFRLDHQAAFKSSFQDGLSCEEVACSCYYGLSFCPVLSNSDYLNPSRRTGGKQVVQNSGD